MSALLEPGRLTQKVRALTRDTRSGASELAVMALRILRAARPARPAGASSRYVEDVLSLARRIARARQTMAAPATAVGLAAGEFLSRSKRLQLAQDAFVMLRAITGSVADDVMAVRGQTAARFRSRFGRKRSWLTHSYSSTVIAALGDDAAHRSITVCESRPGLEGRRTAKRLFDAGCDDVTVITEAQALRVLGRVDGVVIGCDAIRRDGSVVNKTGSALISAAARQTEIPVIVLGDRFKFARAKAFEAEARDRAQVWNGAPRGVSVENEYFEVVPAGWIDWIVLDDAVVAPVDVAGRVDRVVRNTRAMWR